MSSNFLRVRGKKERKTERKKERKKGGQYQKRKRKFTLTERIGSLNAHMRKGRSVLHQDKGWSASTIQLDRHCSFASVFVRFSTLLLA